MRWLEEKPKATQASLKARAPLRRSNDLVIEGLDDELLVYDRTNKRAHCLNADAARVWQACDGKTDAGRMSAQLDLPLDVVRQAVEELEASGLLDQGLELVNVGSGNGNGNGKAVTRRELAVRSAKVGTAVATAPLILSITAPTAMAAATPTTFACAVYSESPGCSSCATVAGCCCCCQGSLGPCKLCAPTGICQAGLQPCAVLLGGTTSHCSVIGSGGAPSPQGCCGVSTASNCGCAYSPTAQVTPTGGGPGGGAGCCNQHTGVPCTPSSTDTNCVPCCNGKILLTGSAFGCCTTPTDTCLTQPPA